MKPDPSSVAVELAELQAELRRRQLAALTDDEVRERLLMLRAAVAVAVAPAEAEPKP